MAGPPDGKQPGPSISLIVPTRDSVDRLRGLLAHLSEQDGPLPEVVVVDGRSDDATVDYLASLDRAPDRQGARLRLRWQSEPDEGIYDAINKGLALASGELIAVLGCDDRLPDRDTLAQVSRIAAACPADLYAGASILLHPDGRRERRPDEPFGIGALASGIPFCHNAMYVRRDSYERIGPYAPGYRICADAQWVHRAIRAGLSCYRIDRPLVLFDMNGTSSTNPQAVLAESWKAIIENFPGLDEASARAVLEAARGWGPANPALSRCQSPAIDAALAASVAAAVAFRSSPTLAPGLESIRSAPATPALPSHPAPTAWQERLRSTLRGLVSSLRA